MFLLNLKWFMQTLLERGNKMGEYAGLDIKTPFCDHRIVEYAYNMPWEIKSYGGREKGIIRKAMKGILPDAIVLRKKSPYPKTYNPSSTKAVCLKVKEILKNKEKAGTGGSTSGNASNFFANISGIGAVAEADVKGINKLGYSLKSLSSAILPIST